MKLWEGVSTVLAFRIIPTTVLLFVVYAAVFSTVLITDELPEVPKTTGGLDLDQAYADLQQITTRPHPYNSHSNDLVHSYILSRLQSVASQYPHVSVCDDVVSNASWGGGLLSTRPYGVYFEGINILVKIDGTESEYSDKGGVLFSAHYDSVSTAPGATDDGMGVVTLIQMVEYLSKARPKRTVIFNINNGEEDGLNGAHAFMKHPWSNITDVFLNLEGAAAGGRPLLFRATSSAPLRSFSNAYVPHPHANVLSADAFARGVIRSSTDYSVYEEGGMDGLDFSFYRGRSRYHTKYDSIPGMAGGVKALWAMMEATKGAGEALANEDNTHATGAGEQGDKPVYLDLFGAALIILSRQVLFITNVILLVVGPVLLLLLKYSEHIIRLSRRLRHREGRPTNGDVSGDEISSGPRRGFREHRGWFKGLWTRAKFWVAIIVGVGLQILLVLGYVKLNPFIIHSRPYLVFVSTLSLCYLTTVLIMKLPLTKQYTVAEPEQQKLSILLQTYILTWILLVFSTIILRSSGLGGLYFITAWNAVVLLGSVLACVEGMTGARGFEAGDSQGDLDGQDSRRLVRGVRYQAVDFGDEPTEDEGVIEETAPTEITPLIQQQRSPSQSQSELPRLIDEREQGAIGWWILQLLVVVPLPAILVFHISVILLAAMNQTLTDGSNPVSIYACCSILALLVILPLAPFGINAHRSLTILILLIFIVSTAYNWLEFPFSQEAPLKVYFYQNVSLDTLGSGVERVVTTLTGPEGYLVGDIIPLLPSSAGRHVECRDSVGKLGLQECMWEVGKDDEDAWVPSPGSLPHHESNHETPWVSGSVKRIGSNKAQFIVSGRNTRSCTIQFENRRVTSFSIVDDEDEAGKFEYRSESSGLERIQLWSRDWGKEFVVEVEWIDPDNSYVAAGDFSGSEVEVTGRISCGWAEYESATVGGGNSGGKIPSLEELLMFLPEWAVVSKASAALFEAGIPFVV
ncbi:hypothetical protein SERLA73DRAFT_50249 [Serpula lacrymans var. lacrymans S7.3]|uniref:Peptide hydrolase n=1 Tax=Serpula lacrymans var. lacrymans (strain S7.3) TaxID=936435 RepID=F8PRC9_SERL3|nr:hypothetical protein SERLA73DRAFT_50249 [Serpula lacrymans var. lacrymans S7.3]